MIAAADDGIDKPGLLRKLGLDPDAESDVDLYVSGEAYLELLEELAEMMPGPVSFHLRAGSTMRCDDFGVLGLAAKSAPTLLDSFLRIERYGALLVSEPVYSVETIDAGVCIRINRPDAPYGLRLSNEAALSTFWSLSKEATGRTFNPVAVYYAHASPGAKDHYVAFFGCPVHFNSDFNGLCVDEGLAKEPNKVGDSAIVQYFDQQLDAKVKKFNEAPSWRLTVRDEIARALSGGQPRKKDIARELGVSDRTLLRRLSDEGLSFKGIVEETQRDLAKQLLTKTNYSLAEVAFMTGFSDQSTFNRAFKRWAGQTPRSYRLSP